MWPDWTEDCPAGGERGGGGDGGGEGQMSSSGEQTSWGGQTKVIWGWIENEG